MKNQGRKNSDFQNIYLFTYIKFRIHMLIQYTISQCNFSYENYISLASYIKYTCKYTFMAKSKNNLQYILSIVLFDVIMKIRSIPYEVF